MVSAIILLVFAIGLIVAGVSSFPPKNTYQLQNYDASQLSEMERNSVMIPEGGYKLLSEQPFWTEHRAGGHFEVDRVVRYYAMEVQSASGEPYVIGLQMGSKQVEMLASGSLKDLHGTVLPLDESHTANLAQYADGQRVYGYFLSSTTRTAFGDIIKGTLMILSGAVCLVMVGALLKIRK